MTYLRNLLRQIEFNSNGYLSPVVLLLIVANVILYFADLVLLRMLEYPPFHLAFSMRWDLFIELQWWRAVTGGFMHAGFMHLLFNVLFFGFFAREVVHRLGSRRFLIMIFTAIILGNVCEGALNAMLGNPNIWILGFSGALLATLTAFATINPYAPVVFFIVVLPAWLLVTIFVLMDVAGLLEGQSGIANTAHLTGAAVGFFAIRKPRLLAWGDRVANLGQSIKHWRNQRADQRRQQADEYLDYLLDKVSKQGLTSLTPAERSFLTRYSDRKKQNN